MKIKSWIAACGLAVSLLAQPAAAGQFEDATAAYGRGDYATALKLMRPLADQGNAHAQYNLGRMYANGWGVPQDYAEAVKWYRLAPSRVMPRPRTASGACTTSAAACRGIMLRH